MRTAHASRRGFLAALAAVPALAQKPGGSELGNLWPGIQAIADDSPRELSFLKPEYRDLGAWQKAARAKLLDLLEYAPPPVRPEAQVRSRVERDGFIEEQVVFRTSRHSSVPAHVLIPARGKPPFPGVVALHDHGGFYLWGREKIVATEPEAAPLREFKQRYYSGRSIANELVRAGYVVIAIDMFYWGERRRLLPDDPAAWRDRPAGITAGRVEAFNKRAGGDEDFIARALMTAGVSWAGVLLWDDMRTLDYLASRPEVDASRLACAGLSVGGYRSFLLAALDPRIKAAIDAGWLTAFASQIEAHVRWTMGLTFMIPGMYRYFDLPDLAALIAPRALLVQMGSQDRLFPPGAVRKAFEHVGRCYQKAGAPSRQSCRLYEAPHEFNAQMQAEAWDWLRRTV